jgi:hypothetical protein
MEACAFDEKNAILGPPPGVSDEVVTHLSVRRTRTLDGTPVVISCWKPTAEEWEEMKRTGRVWLVVWGENMPPCALCGVKPFVADTPL